MDRKNLTSEQAATLLATLESRFKANPMRHAEIEWHAVLEKLNSNPDALRSLQAMEASGGEPDVMGYDKSQGKYLFVDCAKESPEGRRSLCYDRKALDSRKEAKPVTSAMDMAEEMGIELLDETLYRKLQELGEFDLKTSSWVLTTPAVRKLGGALFMDRRYDRVFVYHNGAQSYYSGRGFRGVLFV